jgi:hypothetical protein
VADYFVKMWKRMLRSSFAALDPVTKWLFITLLCEAEPDGSLYATIEYLSAVSRLSEDEVEQGLTVLQQPDPASTTTDHEGRRLLAVGPNEWFLVNYEKYRKMGAEEERRERDAERKRVARAAARADSGGQVRTHADTCGQGGTGTDPSRSRSISTSVPTTEEEAVPLPVPFDAWWSLVTRKESKVESQRYWEGKKATTTGDKITPVEQHLILAVWPHHEAMWLKENRTRDKKPHPRTWLHQRRWEDEVPGTEDNGDGDKWVVDTYRRSDHQRFNTHRSWTSYLDYAADQPPREALSFEWWLEKGGGGADTE